MNPTDPLPGKPAPEKAKAPTEVAKSELLHSATETLTDLLMRSLSKDPQLAAKQRRLLQMLAKDPGAAPPGSPSDSVGGDATGHASPPSDQPKR